MVALDHNMYPTKGTTALGGSPHTRAVCDLAVARLGLAVGAALATLLVATGAPAAVAVALIPAAVAAAFDLHCGRLPDGWVAAIFVSAFAVAVVRALPGLGTSSVAAVFPPVVVAAATLALHLVDPAAFGWGDVKYTTALAFTLSIGLGVDGNATWLVLAVWLCVASGSAIVEAVVRHRTTVAFGSHLLVASVVVTAARTAGGGV